MKRNYSANDELKNLAQNLDFTIYLFDDPNELGSEIKLREKSKDGEIDAILVKDNVIILIGVNEGSGDKVIKEMEKYFEKLDKIQKVEDLKLEIKVTKKRKKNIEEKQKLANQKIKEINEHMSKFSQTHDIILKKIFFVPNKQIEEEYLRDQKVKDNIIVDKDTYQYFLEILNRLNKNVLFSDFIHFLGIGKSDLKKKGASKTHKPAKSTPFKVTRLPLDKDKMIMYSFSPRVEDIIDYVTVLRMSQKYDKKGFQRMIKSNRLDKINKEYFRKN